MPTTSADHGIFVLGRTNCCVLAPFLSGMRPLKITVTARERDAPFAQDRRDFTDVEVRRILSLTPFVRRKTPLSNRADGIDPPLYFFFADRFRKCGQCCLPLAASTAAFAA